MNTPRVSIIVPCYNEEKTIQLLLDALLQQTFPADEMEIVIADGLSTDSTRQRIAEFQADHPSLTIRVVDNPARTIPSGLNQAVKAARGEFLVRLDAHSAPRSDYVARCVAALEQGIADNVGGVWEILPRGQSWQAQSIAVAAAHPLGVGDAHYRYTERAQAVDTVPFGAFRWQTVERLGGYNENLLTNEDYEFNVRLRQAGGKIWLDPSIRSVYYARSTLMDLARQYSRYGYWKARMLRRYPGTIRWRQALPPAFILSLLVLGLLSLVWPLSRWLFVLELSLYIMALLVIGVDCAVKRRNLILIIGVPLAIATMHLCWGAAFLWSMIAR